MKKIHNLSNPQMVTYSVFRLGGEIQPVDVEDVAIDVFEFVPKRFSWRKYKEKIDLAIVRYALADAAKARYGPMLSGGAKEGYLLTLTGLEFVRAISRENSNADEVFASNPRRNSVLGALEFERARLLRAEAFIKFQSAKEQTITQADFYDFVRVNPYFPKKARFERFAVIDSAIVGDEKLVLVWKYLKQHFSEEWKTK